MNLDGYKELISFSWWQHWLLFIQSLAVWVSAPRQMMQTVEFLHSKENFSRGQTKMNSRDAWTTKHPSKDTVNPLTMLWFMVMYLPQTHEVNRVIIYDIPLQERRVTWVRSVFGHCCHSTRAPSWVSGTLMWINECVRCASNCACQLCPSVPVYTYDTCVFGNMVLESSTLKISYRINKHVLLCWGILSPLLSCLQREQNSVTSLWTIQHHPNLVCEDTTSRVWFGEAQAQEGSLSSGESPFGVKDLEFTSLLNSTLSSRRLRNEQNLKAKMKAARMLKHLFLELIHHIQCKVVSVN